jgi:hypothetical protein
MVAGAILLLIQMDYLEYRSILHYWPILPLVLGTVKIVAPGRERDVLGGADLVMLGLWGLACQNHWLGLTWRNSLPLILVAIGVRMVLGSLFGSRGRKGETPKEEIHHA